PSAVRGIVAPVSTAASPAAASSAVAPAALSPVTAIALAAVPAVALTPVMADLVAVEIIVVVDVDLVVSPAAAAPHAAPEGAHGKAHSEPDERRAHRVVGVVDRRVRVNRWAVNDDRIIGRDIDDVRLRWLDDDDFFLLDDLGLDLLLLVGRQRALV